MVWPSGKLVRKWSWMRYAAVDRKVPALRVLRFCVSSAWSLAPTAAVKEYPTVQHAISTIYDSISRLCDSMLWWQKDAPGAPESHGISWCSCRGAIWVRWCEIPSAGCVVLWVPTEYTNIRAMDTLELGPTNQQITARSKHRKMIMMTQMLMYTIYIYHMWLYSDDFDICCCHICVPGASIPVVMRYAYVWVCGGYHSIP